MKWKSFDYISVFRFWIMSQGTWISKLGAPFWSSFEVRKIPECRKFTKVSKLVESSWGSLTRNGSSNFRLHQAWNIWHETDINIWIRNQAEARSALLIYSVRRVKCLIYTYWYKYLSVFMYFGKSNVYQKFSTNSVIDLC